MGCWPSIATIELWCVPYRLLSPQPTICHIGISHLQTLRSATGSPLLTMIRNIFVPSAFVGRDTRSVEKKNFAQLCVTAAGGRSSRMFE